MPGVFIDVHVSDAVREDPVLAQQLSDVCPVDIFAATPEGGEVVESNLDECILCGLCVEAAPPGAVKVEKLYDNGSMLER